LISSITDTDGWQEETLGFEEHLPELDLHTHSEILEFDKYNQGEQKTEFSITEIQSWLV